MFGKIIRQMLEQIKSLQPRDSEDIIVGSRGPDGVSFLLADHLKRQDSPSLPGGISGSSDYYGPWAVVQKNTTTVTVKAYAAGSYLSKSLVIAGLTTEEQATDADVTVTTSGVIYADITQSGGTYSIAYANASALPAQSSTHYYVELAAVTFASSAITGLSQTQYGQIHVAGRVV